MNFGKCHQYFDPTNPMSGIQCKCFMFRATVNDEYLCACCGHDRNYHEPSSQLFNSTSIHPSVVRELNTENFYNMDDIITPVVRKGNDFKVINLLNAGPKPKIPRG
jgi:hypothetical protein